MNLIKHSNNTFPIYLWRQLRTKLLPPKNHTDFSSISNATKSIIQCTLFKCFRSQKEFFPEFWYISKKFGYDKNGSQPFSLLFIPNPMQHCMASSRRYISICSGNHFGFYLGHIARMIWTLTTSWFSCCTQPPLQLDPATTQEFKGITGWKEHSKLTISGSRALGDTSGAVLQQQVPRNSDAYVGVCPWVEKPDNFGLVVVLCDSFVSSLSAGGQEGS